MHTLGDHIKNKLDDLGMTQQSLAQKLNIEAGYMSQIINSKKVPSVELAERIGKIVDPDNVDTYARLALEERYARKGRDSILKILRTPKPTKPGEPAPCEPMGEHVKITKVPITGTIEAGHFTEQFDQPAEPVDYVYTTLPYKKLFALKVQGESMVPEYLPGDIVIVDTSRKGSAGSDVIAQNHAYEGCIKQLKKKEGGGFFLKPYNPDFPTIDVDESVHIVGVVVQLIRKKSAK